jgi:maltose/moltooligosaccharide transporter
MKNQPRLSFWQMWNMSFGFFGIQFGWGLQMANMSSIYEYLGAREDQLAFLWLAAPLTGLLVQPIIGHCSDRTWGRLGRRRPYFLAGAVLATGALIAMPNSSALWMAVGLLWILDASVNISMEPFRAFVADLLPPEQRKAGFVLQSFFIGLGAVIASALPWILLNVVGLAAGGGAAGRIPTTVRLSFYAGSAVFLAAVLYTILTTREYPPEDLAAFERKKAEGAGLRGAAREIVAGIAAMPGTMRQLAWVQFFTWLGLFCMWIYFSVAVAHHVFGAEPGSATYEKGIAWGGVCFSVYNAVCFVFSLVLVALSRRFTARAIHAACLICGGLGLLSVAVIREPGLLLLSMAGVGIAWASILSMPYAMLAGALPADRMGFYMGVFNFFIVIPQIIASVGFGWLMTHFLGGNRMAAVVCGGVALLVASALTWRVRETPSVPVS